MSRPSKAIPATSGSDHLQRRLREVAFLLLLPVVVYLLACLLSYSPQDPGWSHAGEPEHIRMRAELVVRGSTAAFPRSLADS